ncbi:MAG TPA: aspartate aminotransferase family protein [Pyrinomonadaceae bacterium]|nr:aspartate aminotransferase family protein [Pyrinomonadaceae bacterium]
MKSYSKSLELYERAQLSLAGGVSSNYRMSKHPHPLFFVRGEGSRIYDVDGNEYLDFTLSQGPLFLGHCHPHVQQRVIEEIKKGQLYAGQHQLELNLAEKLQQHIHCAELVRFTNSGSESVQATLRIARAFTSRSKYIKFEGHYHGWFDNVLVSLQPSLDTAGPRTAPNAVLETKGQVKSVQDDVVVLPWNDLDIVENALQQHGDEIAAIITEPIMCNNGCIEPKEGFLQGLRALCDRYGVVLIFDETITGFRLGLGGAQALYGVTPDLAIFGKAMASGFAISLFAGKKELMNLIAKGEVTHAGTYNSNNACVAAAMATLEVLEDGGDELRERIFTLGCQLRDSLRDIARNHAHNILLSGPGPMFHMAFTSIPEIKDYRDCLDCDSANYGQFVKNMLDRGVRLIGRGLWYLSAAHTTADIDLALGAANDALTSLKND